MPDDGGEIVLAGHKDEGRMRKPQRHDRGRCHPPHQDQLRDLCGDVEDERRVGLRRGIRARRPDKQADVAVRSRAEPRSAAHWDGAAML